MLTSVLSLAKPTHDHALQIATRMRATDRSEVWLSHKHAPLEALEVALARSRRDSYTVMAGDEPIALFGVGIGSLIANTGSPWMLGTPAMAQHTKEILRLSIPLVNFLRGGYARLENYVYSGNITSIVWLHKCGFTIDAEEPYGPFGAKFRRFWMVQESPVCADQL